MRDVHSKIPRIFVEAALEKKASVSLPLNQTHYLRNVLRMEEGDALCLFNGRDGEWRGALENIGKKGATITIESLIRPQTPPADLWALFAPVKKEGTDMMVEKATELGVSVLWPVLTARSNTQRVNTERWQANAIEASEQCERLEVPEIRDLKPLEEVLAGWPSGRILFVCAERGQAIPAAKAFAQHKEKPAAVLIGPEGGFTESEMAELESYPFIVKISLGERILRAETALIAALAGRQLFSGI